MAWLCTLDVETRSSSAQSGSGPSAVIGEPSFSTSEHMRVRIHILREQTLTFSLYVAAEIPITHYLERQLKFYLFQDFM